jgi:hypothetical protein
MNLLVSMEEFDCFREVSDFPAASIPETLITAVKKLDESEEIEPFIRTILADSNATLMGLPSWSISSLIK